MQKITPCLWFKEEAEEAAKFYTSIFKDSKVLGNTYYDEESSKVSGRKKGSVMTVEFEIEGQKFTLLNGGPEFEFTPAISFVIECESQEEVDYYWNSLTAGGKEVQCGWLEDKYGVSWQVVPTILNKLLADNNKTKAEKVMRAMLQMKKIEIQELKNAYES